MVNQQNLILIGLGLLLAGLLYYYLVGGPGNGGSGGRGEGEGEGEGEVEGFTSYSSWWYWPNYYYRTYWPYYRRSYYYPSYYQGGRPLGRFNARPYNFGRYPYRSYYRTYYW